MGIFFSTLVATKLLFVIFFFWAALIDLSRVSSEYINTPIPQNLLYMMIRGAFCI